ncbi:MAG TPA: DUF6448 family protein [Planctomycetota bacterium]|nr:DUF6448 family protein [Planctomycetota bacterium]
MKRTKFIFTVVLILTVAAGELCLFAGRPALTHCDTLGGPVVTDAKIALEKGDLSPILKWVQKEQQDELTIAFKKVLAVRSSSKDPVARDLAEAYFFETAVRLHRASEGEPYTGLKPAGDIEPPVAAADKALADGSTDRLIGEVNKAIADELHARFARLIETQKHKDESTDAGRRYVAAYVQYVHFVEALHHITHEGAAHTEGAAKHAE